MGLSFHRDCLTSSSVVLPPVMSRESRLTVAWLSTPPSLAPPSSLAGLDSKAVVSKIPNWAPQSQGQGPRCRFTPWPATLAQELPAQEEVRDLAAGP